MGSFVPFGGFFPSQSNFPSQLSSPNQSFTRCHQCNEKYEQELAAIWKPGSTTVTGRHSESSLHMAMTELDARSKEFDVNKVCNSFEVNFFDFSGVVDLLPSNIVLMNFLIQRRPEMTEVH